MANCLFKKKNLCFPKDVEGVVVVVSEISSSVAIPLPAHVLQGCSGGLLLGFLPALLFLQPTLSHNDWRKAGSGIHIRFFKNLFIIIIWLLWVFVAVCRFSLVVEGGAIFCCSAWTSYSGGFPCCGAEVLGRQALGIVARGLSSCGTWAWLFQGVWNLPGPGIEAMFSALACGFLSTVPAYQFEE